jgi:hypothetical protein
MDEIKDWRIRVLESADGWEIRHQIPRGCVHVDKTDNLANADALAAPLRRQPALKVIQGGRNGTPRQDQQGRIGQARLFVVK